MLLRALTEGSARVAMGHGMFKVLIITHTLLCTYCETFKTCESRGKQLLLERTEGSARVAMECGKFSSLPARGCTTNLQCTQYIDENQNWLSFFIKHCKSQTQFCLRQISLSQQWRAKVDTVGLLEQFNYFFRQCHVGWLSPVLAEQ